ncbi:MAG: threonine aldolase [Planctomycetaceae bacterium]|nr:threonine aldolase [Planctomycetaceae bacterium]
MSNERPRNFASDNYSGICPEAWQSMQEANAGHEPAYGEDRWTHRATDLLREVFEFECDIFFTFNGTSANALALASLCQSYHSIICHELAHVETDECGSPEFFSNGTKILLVNGEHGRVPPEAVVKTVNARDDIHFPKPKVLSITQATEVGTVYKPADLDALSETVRRRGLKMHMDGARFANAVATLNVSPKEITWKVGVDVLCLGGTKNGLAVGEAVIFFNKDLADEFGYRCKQAGQLASKMRFLAAPWVGMIESEAWLNNARHANARALQLQNELKDIDGIEFLAPVEANAVFVELPAEVIKALREERYWRFYTFIGEGGCRFMCSWDTTEDDVAELAKDIKELMALKANHKLI